MAARLETLRLPLGIGLLALLAVTAAGCGRGLPQRGRVAVSIFPLYDVVRRVAGPDLAVDLILPPGHTDHSFDPKPQDVARLAEARMVFAIGLGLEQWLPSMLKAAGDGQTRLFELGPLLDPMLVPEDVLELAEGSPSHEAGAPVDPHVWMDPRRMERATDLVVDALEKLDPDDGPQFRRRADDVKRSLAGLDQELVRRSQGWTKETIATFHGSMFYFASRYGLRVAAVVEPIPGREPSPRYVARVVEALRKGGVAALFTEPQFDPRPAQVIAAEAGLPVFEVDAVGGGPGAEGYEKLLRKDAAVFDEALR
jgi:ABC-type Zn uptake system ZnuABC Zn-binding protein ZnuA